MQPDSPVFLIRDPKGDHAQYLHVLQPSIAATRQRDLLLYPQVHTATSRGHKNDTGTGLRHRAKSGHFLLILPKTTVIPGVKLVSEQSYTIHLTKSSHTIYLRKIVTPK